MSTAAVNTETQELKSTTMSHLNNFKYCSLLKLFTRLQHSDTITKICHTFYSLQRESFITTFSILLLALSKANVIPEDLLSFTCWYQTSWNITTSKLMFFHIIPTILSIRLGLISLYYVPILGVSLAASGSWLVLEPLNFSASLLLLFLIILTKVSNRVGFGICSTMWASSRINSPLWASPAERLCSDITCCSQSLCDGSTWRHHLHESLGDCVWTALMWRRLKPQLVYARSQKGQGNGGYGKFFEAKCVNSYKETITGTYYNNKWTQLCHWIILSYNMEGLLYMSYLKYLAAMKILQALYLQPHKWGNEAMIKLQNLKIRVCKEVTWFFVINKTVDIGHFLAIAIMGKKVNTKEKLKWSSTHS